MRKRKLKICKAYSDIAICNIQGNNYNVLPIMFNTGQAHCSDNEKLNILC